jgi:hypothetical protein
VVNSSCSNTQTASRALQSWAALLGTNWICPGCSITHPSIAAPIQLQLLATLPCTLFLERQFFWICIHTRFRECGASSETTQRQRHAARAKFDRKQAPSHPESTSPVHPPTQPVLRFHRHHDISSNFVHAVPCKSLAISTVLTTLRSRQVSIGGFPTTTRLHRDLLTIPTTNLFI